MKKFLKKVLTPVVIKLADRFSSRPDKTRVDDALTKLYANMQQGNTQKGQIIPFDAAHDRFVILSDQHKGAKDHSDDFALAEKNYNTALDYYFNQNFYYINLGDSEELWENNIAAVKKNNPENFAVEKTFLPQKRFTKIFGNHDLYWDNDPLAAYQLKLIYGEKIKIYEAVLLKTSIAGKPLDIFLTHGHQGDLQSDGNWFSKWFVANIWAPFQAFLDLNPNTPAYDVTLKTAHNSMMYDWSSKQDNVLLITGHTHQPVFESLTQLERLYQQLGKATKEDDQEAIKKIRSTITVRFKKGDAVPDFSAIRPTYFNSGCCCFSDGDITGIEVADGCIRLIKWKYDASQLPVRMVLEETRLDDLVAVLQLPFAAAKNTTAQPAEN